VAIYSPWQGGALVGVKVSAIESGSCWTGSLAVARSDAWRCMTGNEIIDPCFSDPDDTQAAVACPNFPDLEAVTEIRLTQPLNPSMADKDQTGGDPWAVEIVGGAECEIITGASDEVAGRRLNYGCTDQTTQLYGDPDRSAPEWTIFEGRHSSAELTPIGILRAFE